MSGKLLTKALKKLITAIDSKKKVDITFQPTPYLDTITFKEKGKVVFAIQKSTMDDRIIVQLFNHRNNHIGSVVLKGDDIQKSENEGVIRDFDYIGRAVYQSHVDSEYNSLSKLIDKLL